MNPSSPKFCFPSDVSDPVPHIPRNLNNQVETNVNLVSSHLALYTLNANIILKPPGTPYPRAQTENSVKAYSIPSNNFAASIDELEKFSYFKRECHINIQAITVMIQI